MSVLVKAGLRPAGVAGERLFAAPVTIPRKGNIHERRQPSVRGGGRLPRAQAQERGRAVAPGPGICLARLGEAADTDVCCFGYAGAWARKQLTNGPARALNVETVEAEAAEIGLRLVTAGDDVWPAGLDDLSCHSPAVLAPWIAGEPLTLREAVTITGARAATSHGMEIAREMAYELASRGHTIVTGLSHGIDASALKGALAANGPGPVVVLASGVADDVPPRLQSEEDLVCEMLVEATVITERPPGAKPTRIATEERSRILGSISKATVIVEGSRRSSTWYAARWAGRDLGRVVCAVPGPVTSAQSQLPQHLIQTGLAQLVTSAQDVTDALDTTTITDREPAAFADSLEALDALRSFGTTEGA